MRLHLALIFFVSAAPLLRAGDNPIAPERFTTTDARCERMPSGALRVSTGTNESWPGITLPAPGGQWDWSAHSEFALTVKNIDSDPVQVFCRIDNPGADGKDDCANGNVTVEPGQSQDLRVVLVRTSSDTLGDKLFGMRGYPVTNGGPETVDPSNITQILVFVSKPTQRHSFEISVFRTGGTYTPPTAWTSDAQPFFPFIDTFGQYLHKDWPDKTKSPADLAAQRETEEKEWQAQPRPPAWDKYGGDDAGPQLRASGFFRTEKYHGKWWLVDPDGRVFFSNGIDCIGQSEITPITDRTNWFTDLPDQPEFAAFWSRPRALLGHYANKFPDSFCFSDANLFRKYGPEWRARDAGEIHHRLASWGINTIGNWSAPQVVALRLTPYTDSIGSWGAKMIEGSDGYWGKFPDVFDTSFSNSLFLAAREKQGRSAGDPWCLGFFSDNEMSWGDDTSIAEAALKSPGSQAAKRALVEDLRVKYGEISGLNAAWKTGYASWDDLLEGRYAPDAARAGEDLRAFYTKAAEQYFRIARAAVKSAAPDQLYLGCRFAWVNDRAAAAAAKYCDVVSYNIYKRDIAGFKFHGGADVPLLIGEFHFGALDRGLFHTGLVPTDSQQARADAYKDYVQGALHHPQFVGVHWFQYRDEPVTGRSWDGENYQIGFVDVADTPYRELIAAAREVGYHLYDAVSVN